jgi:predicted nucleic acid-binding Zn ribbon protein
MSCSLCGSTIHNMRTCSKNDQRGIKKNKKRNMAPEVTVHPGESSHQVCSKS